MRNKIIPILLSLILLLAACTSPAEPTTLKIAVLPIIDTLPMYVAQQEGLFEKHNVSVAFVPVASAPERDQILSAGQADGAILPLEIRAITVRLFRRGWGIISSSRNWTRPSVRRAARRASSASRSSAWTPVSWRRSK